MKKNDGMKLNTMAFALAGGIIGLVSVWFMPGMMGYGSGMMGFNNTGYAWMMGGGFGLNIWMALTMGIIAGIFAWVYNTLIEKMN